MYSILSPSFFFSTRMDCDRSIDSCT
jgi:hypothetical protein